LNGQNCSVKNRVERAELVLSWGMRAMTAGGSHLHDAGHYFDRCVPPERKWREPTEWTRTKVRVNRLSYTSSGLTPYVAVNSLLTRLFFTSRGFFLRTRSALRASLRAR